MSLDSLFVEDGIVVDLTGVRQVIKHSVQQGLNTFVFQSAAHQHWREGALDSGPAYSRLKKYNKYKQTMTAERSVTLLK